MILTELIRDQILGVTVMFGAGIAVAFMYQMFRCFCRVAVSRKWAAAVLEIIFWIAAAYFTSRFLYYCAYGKLSVHTICGFACGALLWKVCFYDIIYKICTFLEKKFGIEKNHGKEETKQSV